MTVATTKTVWYSTRAVFRDIFTKKTAGPNMVANRDEQVMVKDIFGIDVDIYENK